MPKANLQVLNLQADLFTKRNA